jgi:ribonucleotide reductase beta subunit family protein with ferritin-like domain
MELVNDNKNDIKKNNLKELISTLPNIDINSNESLIKLNHLLKDNISLRNILDNMIEKNNKLDKKDTEEPLLNSDNKRFTVFPIKYHDIWNMYKKMEACFWKAEEIDFSQDYKDFKTLNEHEQHFLKRILAFFAASDGIVNFNLEKRFGNEIQIMEAKIVYDFQKMMENIHGEVYSQMLDNIIKDDVEKKELFNAINTIPTIKKMADWSFKWIDSSDSFAHRVVAFTVVEGVFFSGAFASIFWFKKIKNKGGLFLPGLTKSNEFIARDEGLHTDFGCLLYSHIKNRLDQKTIYNIVDEGVLIAKEFINDALPYKLMGMNKDMMCNYIEYVADRLLITLNYDKLYNKNNPFKFMETIGMIGKTNFFEARPTDYQDANIFNNSKDEFEIDNDF